MGSLRLSLACFDYDRTSALRDGSVAPEGIELVYLALPVEETFYRMLRHREFDVAEMSLSSYSVALLTDDPWLVATPVFPSRAFRHSGVFVHTGSGIERPEDLRGKVVGVAEYQLTANVWIRGILAEHHGVPVESVAYRTAGLEQPERQEKLALDLPPEIDLAPLASGRSLSSALAAGEIDALYTPRAPSSFLRGEPAVARLWPDAAAAEAAYFAQTGIFPIMHTLVIRRELHERHRWVARSLFEAFSAARSRLRAVARDGGVAVHAAVPPARPRARPGDHGPGLLAVRPRAQPPRARDVPALPPRAGPLAAADRPRRAVRARDA